ncbi:Protein RALF-like 33 [Bienertia sinuspersici]
MADTRKLYTIIAVGLILAIISAVDAGGEFDSTMMGFFSSGSGCKGSVGECLGGENEEEFEMDTEINRRILATNNYISYGALNRNRVPCSRRGASYYNCRPGAQANPYSRGCSAITRCARR